jgi:phage anti-repressor protein
MELIKIQQNEQGSNVVSARNLYEFLEATERFGNWFERQLQYGFVEGVDFTRVKSLTLVNNGAERQLEDFALTLDCAKEIAMVQRSEKGKQARLYFIECEKQLKQIVTHSYQIEDPIKRAEKWIEEQKEKQLLLTKTENLETVLDNLLEWVSIIKVAQFNKVNEKAFNWRLLKAKSEELGYVIKKAESPRYGFQNLYHVDCFKAVYPMFNYNFK